MAEQLNISDNSKRVVWRAECLGFIDDMKLSKTKNDLTKESETHGASYPDSTVEQTVKASVILVMCLYLAFKWTPLRGGSFSLYAGRKNLAPRIS